MSNSECDKRRIRGTVERRIFVVADAASLRRLAIQKVVFRSAFSPLLFGGELGRQRFCRRLGRRRLGGG